MSYVVPKRKRLVLVLVLGFFVVGALAIFVVRDTTQFFIEKQAEQVAEIVGVFAKTARSVYNSEVISKLKQDGFGAHVDFEAHPGYIPIPAQFLKALGKATEQNTANLFHYRPVSRWNIEPSQGISNDFLEWAWPQLEAQDQMNPKKPIDWQPVFRIEKVEGVNVLRYLTADPANSLACVSCHNYYETTPEVRAMRLEEGVPTGKQWKQYQLLGALEITIPLDRIEWVASEQLNRAIFWISVIFLGCLGFIAGVYFLNTRLHRNIENLSWEANHDALTELLNRRGFEDAANHLWEVAVNDHKEHALLLLDLDKFKQINDSYGHQAGDAILKEVATQLKSERREADVVARLGGDEFAVLLSYCPLETAEQLAQRILNKVNAICLDWKGEKLSVGVSIGLASINASSESIEQVIQQADSASYVAKRSPNKKVIAYGVSYLDSLE